MNILTLDNVTKAYGERKILDQASFYLQEGDKVGVIGINGTGKSTFLRILSDLEETDEGTRTIANNYVLRHLPQQPVFDPEMSALDSVLPEGISGEERVQAASEARNMLTRLGVNNFDQKCGELSGGQKKRLALVRTLLAPSDILVLDEPTNHLDNDMADWLEDYLKRYRGALVMVTHDRYFLDSVTNRIAELDHGKIYTYQENYEGYLERKAERMERDNAAERKRQSILRTELKWVQRGARARTTKQKARLERYEELKNRTAPERDGAVEMGSVFTRMGRTTVEIEGLTKGYGNRKLIDDFTYYFLRGDRIGFIGPNGCGKTTLMKLLTGLIVPDAGEIRVGQTIKIGYYAQEIGGVTSVNAIGVTEAEDPELLRIDPKASYMDPSLRVIDYIRDTAEYVQTTEGPVSAAVMLERFLFMGEDQYGLIGKLSGGEKRRLNLLRVLMEAPNVLILDEPTNDLDVTTLAILEDYLDSFDGIVITVSHDRYFLDRIVSRIFAFEGDGRLVQYEGGYTDYRLRKDMESGEYALLAEKKSAPAVESAGPKGKPKDQKGSKLKFTYKEQKEYETIEADMAALEEKIGKLEDQILKEARNFVRLNELTKEKEQAEALLEEKMDRWMYLEDLAARIAEQN